MKDEAEKLLRAGEISLSMKEKEWDDYFKEKTIRQEKVLKSLKRSLYLNMALCCLLLFEIVYFAYMAVCG
tara:strand:- start:9307 stop:9516 length:210 start_codon:yes stop_codon:yes gene_type:complete